jgi:hypothetical protein
MKNRTYHVANVVLRPRVIYSLCTRLGVLLATYVADGNRAPPSRTAYIRVFELYGREGFCHSLATKTGSPQLLRPWWGRTYGLVQGELCPKPRPLVLCIYKGQSKDDSRSHDLSRCVENLNIPQKIKFT